MNKNILLAALLIVTVVLLAYIGIIQKRLEHISSQQPVSIKQDIVKTKLISMNHAYSTVAGYDEGQLLFTDVSNGKQYPVSLCVKRWPNLKIDSYYNLNLTDLANNIRFNGMLAGCYVGDLNILFSNYYSPDSAENLL